MTVKGKKNNNHKPSLAQGQQQYCCCFAFILPRETTSPYVFDVFLTFSIHPF